MPPAPALLGLLSALAVLSPAARAQDATLSGTCERLTIADQDVPACRGGLTRLSAPNFASFAFSTEDGRTLGFTGTGLRPSQDTGKDAGQDAGELPVTLVTPGLKGAAGIARSPTPATGTCRVRRAAPGRTEIACEARAQGKLYAGRFVAAAEPAAVTGGGAKP